MKTTGCTVVGSPHSSSLEGHHSLQTRRLKTSRPKRVPDENTPHHQSLQVHPPHGRGLSVDRLHLVEVLLRHVRPHREAEIIPQEVNPLLHELDKLVQLLELGEGVLQELLPLRTVLNGQRSR